MDRVLLKRLTVVHSAIALVILLSTASALFALRSVARQTERTSEIDHRLELVDQLRSDAVELARSARRFLLDGDLQDQRRVIAIENEMRRVRSYLGEYATPLDPQLDDYIKTVTRNMTGDGSPAGMALGTFEDALHSVRSALWTAFDTLVRRDRTERETARSPGALVAGAQIGLVVAALFGALLIVAGVIAVDRIRHRESERARTAEATLERTAAARRELLAASMALRTPLERITNGARLLRATARHDQTEPLDEIANASARVASMLRDLLDVTSLQAGTASLRRESSQSTTLIDRVIAEYRERAREHGLRLRAEVYATMPISVDRERMGYTLGTLVHMAIESAQTGAEIVLAAASYPDGVRFTVTDALIPPGAEGRLASSPNDLAFQIARCVVEAHGGRLGVETSPRSRVYWFTLPTEPSLLK